MTPAHRPLATATRQYRKDMSTNTSSPTRGKMRLDDSAPTPTTATTGPRFEVSLSWPDSSLMQNRSNGRSWTYSHGAKTTQRQEAYLLARQALTRSGVEIVKGDRYRVTMRFHPPDNRRRDVSNLHAAMKAALDGIAEAMEVDDSTFVEHAQRMGHVYMDGRVDVAVERI